MEALVLLLAEFIFLPLCVAFMLIFSGAGSLLQLIFELIALMFGWKLAKPALVAPTGSLDAEPPVPAKPSGKPRVLAPTWRWLRRIAWVCLALLIFSLLAVTILNAFFFEPTVRWTLARAGAKTGVQVTFDDVEGSLWAGRIELGGLHIQRDNHQLSNFDLRADGAVVDVSMTDLIQQRAVFEEVSVWGLRGKYQRLAAADKVGPARSYRIEKLQIDKLNVQVTDHTRGKKQLRLNIDIDSGSSRPMRSRWAVFDVLFRSNADGQINGVAFSIESEEIPGGRRTRWRSTGLPIEPVAHYIGGPLKWIKPIFDSSSPEFGLPWT